MKTEFPELVGAGKWELGRIRMSESPAGTEEGGEEALATAFWDKLAPFNSRLFNYIRKALNFSADAEDVFQETILHAFQYARTYQNGRDYGAWLFGIAHNEIKKHYRKNPGISISLYPERLSPSDNSARRHLVEEILRYAERLKPKQKETFLLFYDQGFTIREIASITGLHEGNIRFILNRARRALRTIVGESCE